MYQTANPVTEQEAPGAYTCRRQLTLTLTRGRGIKCPKICILVNEVRILLYCNMRCIPDKTTGEYQKENIVDTNPKATYSLGRILIGVSACYQGRREARLVD